MNAKSLLAIAAFATLASAGAFAEDGDKAGQFAQRSEGGNSVAEVRAELFAFKQGGVNPWSSSYNLIGDTRSTRTRADVQAEYIASRDQVKAMTGEDSGSAYLSRMASMHRAGPTHVAGATGW